MGGNHKRELGCGADGNGGRSSGRAYTDGAQDVRDGPGAPYRYTSDDLIYAAHLEVKGEQALTREAFLSKGQACLRASPLSKVYGWGVHYDSQGRVALYGRETAEYRNLAAKLPVKVALRRSRVARGA